MAAYDILNTAMGGTLGERLASMRESGMSYRAISGVFATEGYDIGRETIRAWCRDLDLDKGARVPA